MPPQPFHSKFPGASVNFGPDTLKKRPKAALLIAQCIISWTEIEVQTATMLARMLRVNVDSVVALYFTLADERAKHEALYSIAEFVFSDDNKKLFEKIMGIKFSVSKQRNDLAHGLFGSTPLDGDGVAWISTQDRIKYILDINRLLASRSAEMVKHVHFDLRDIASFYTVEDLQSVLDDIASLHRIITMFADLIDVNAPIGQANYLRPKLLNEPLVLKSLSPMDANLEK